MNYASQIYDWRRSLVPVNQTVRAGGEAIRGGLTLGGVFAESPEPGGRAELRMSFPAYYPDVRSSRDASWTFSRIMNGAIMRVHLCNSVQLVSSEALGGRYPKGIMWDNDLPWANGLGWAWRPTAPVARAATRGSTSVRVDLNLFGQILEIGHVVGFSVAGRDYAHVVMDVAYRSDGAAQLTVSPPLRRDLGTDDAMQFRPSMMVQAKNAGEAMGGLISRRFAALGELQYVEALL